MTVLVQYEGYHPNDPEPYHYKLYAMNGAVDEMSSTRFIRHNELETPDELWGETAGWAQILCDSCGTVYWDRTYQGGTVICPGCGATEITPQGAALLPYRGASR